MDPLVPAVVGLAMLVSGSDRVVDGATTVANRAGVSTLFVGVTFVAVGSSIPEVATSVYAGLYGVGDFAVGHILGSVVSQITLGVGVVGLFYPLAMDVADLRQYGGGMLVAMAVMTVAVWSGTLTSVEGVAMVALYLLFLALRYDDVEFDDHVDGGASTSLPWAVAYAVGGMALVVLGGHLLVTNSRALAVGFGVPPYLVGFLTGLGTTAPEIVIAVLAVRRDEANIAVGTLFGSNITDPLFSLGVGAVVGGGFTLSDVAATHVVALYAVAVSALVVVLFAYQEELSRSAAVACVLLYLPVLFL